jgi:hypothetical protein
VTASQAGFSSATYASGRNRIWSFANSDAYGISYFQGAGGYTSGVDMIGLHFGTATVAASQFSFVSDGRLITTGNIGSTSTTVLNLATTGNTGTWIGAIQDGTSGWSLSGATIGFKSDNTTYAAIGIGSGNGILYFGRTTASGVGTMSSWLEVDSGGVANFKRARPQHNGSNLALVSEIPSVSSYLPLAGGSLTGAVTSTSTYTSTNNANVDGSNYIVNTINKSTVLYAYDVQRSGSTVGGILIGGAGAFATGTTVGGNTVLHAGNYTSYSPSLTGSGASGSWGISITGNAATITSQANSATITASTGVNANDIVRRDANGYIYANHVNFSTSETENPTINSFITGNGDGWSRKSSPAHVINQLGLLTTSNYSSYALPLSGGILTGELYAANGITVNSGQSDGRGINLYSGSSTAPTYGLFFATTSNFGTYGPVSADWATYFTMNGTTSRGWIFRDSQTLGNVAAISNQGEMILRSHFEQGNNLGRPNVSWSASGTSTGMVIFYLPGTTANYGMVHMVFDIYEYNSNTVSTVVVGGHNWNTSWYNTGANVIGTCGKEVRLGVKDGRFCVVFGVAGSSWEYGTIVLRKIHNGDFYDNIMNMTGNWGTTQTATESFSSIGSDLRALRTPASFNAIGAITQNGSQVLHAGNYTSYSPSLTGSGASGTWGINVTGTAGSISGFNNPTTAANGNTIVYRDANADTTVRYSFASYHNSSDDVSTGTISHIMAKFGDNYFRSATAAKVAAFISGQTMNISGNATTASNGGVTSVNGQTGAVTVSASGGVTFGKALVFAR